MYQLVADLKEHYKSEVAYVWAREQTGEYPHYHVAVILNEDKANSSYYTISKAGELWAALGGHHVAYPETNAYFVVSRKDNESQTAAVQRLGYLAKKYSKCTAGGAIRRYGVSRMKRRNDLKKQ